MNRFLLLGLSSLLLLVGAGVWWLRSPAQNPAQDPAQEAHDEQSTALQRTAFQRQDLPLQAADSAQEAAVQTNAALVLEWNDKGLQALEDQNPELAVAAFEAALELEPNHETLLSNLANAFVAMAVAMQEQGDLAGAKMTLEGAIKRSPRSAGPYYWLGHLHMRNGDRDRAKEILEAALAAGVEHAAVLRMLADIAAVEGDLDTSVTFMDRALLLSPTDADLLDRAAQLRAERKMFRTFLTDATAHFDSRYDPQDQSMVAALGDLNRDLEAAWQEVVGVLGVQPQDRLLVIWLDAESYRWQAPAWSAALFDGRVRIVIEDYEREQNAIRRTLRHELTHAVLHTIGTELPTWLHEGLAQSVEGRDPQAAIASLPSNGPQQQLTELIGNWTSWTDRARVEEAYAYALSFCHWLRLEYGQSVMASLFLNLNGRTLEEAWSVTFGMSIAASDLAFRAYLKTL